MLSEYCRLYQYGHHWQAGEIDMMEYFNGYKGPRIGQRIDACPCGEKRTVDISFPNTDTDTKE